MSNDIVDDVLEIMPGTNRKDAVKALREITGNLTLKIIIYDDKKMETKIIEQEVSAASVINDNITEQQYIVLYKYKEKYYISTYDCVIPKFMIPKNWRLQMKENFDKNLSDINLGGNI